MGFAEPGGRTRRARLVSASLVLSIAVLLAAPPPLSSDNRGVTDEDYERVHPSAAALRRQLGLDVPGADRVTRHFESAEVQKALGLDGGSSFEDIKSDPDRFQKATRAAASLFEIGGFEAVHEALKRQGITKGGSERLALLRNEMLARAADKVAQKHGRLGAVAVNNFSIAESVKSDIDFTLYPEWHQPKLVQPKGGGGRPPSGEDLKADFYKAYVDLYGIEAGKMEIAAHAAEATVPDWRHAPEVSKFAVEYRKGVSRLVENPEAYFLEGAFRMQVDRRTYAGKKKLYVVHTGNLLDEGAIRENHRASKKIYRSIPPDFRRGYAFGATVGNFHFFGEHAGDPGHFTKYVLRSVEDGIRLLTMREGADVSEWQEFKDLPVEAKDKVVYDAYGPRSGSGFSALEVRKMLDTAIDVRNASGDYAAKKWGIWRNDMLRIWREKHNGAGEPPEAMREGLLKQAEQAYEARCRELMIENVTRAAKARALDFTDARGAIERMRAKKLLPSHIDDDTLRKNLRTATLYETYLAMKSMDAEVRQRIVDAAEGPSKRFLENAAKLAETRNQIFDTPSHWKRGDPDFFEKCRKRWDTEVAKLRTVAYDLNLQRRAGGFERSALKARMRQWGLERMGYSFERPLWAAERSGQKMKGEFKSKKLVGNIANLGNLDSILVIIRAGQDSGWDWYAVGQATLFEGVANLPFAGPLMAAKGALFDGEFLGAAVMVGAYWWPVVGQVYLVGDIAWNTVKIVDHETSEGLVDMMLDGISPDEATGALNTLRRMWGESLEGIVYEEYGPSKFMSPLRPVPGETTAEKRKNWFAHAEAILGPKLKAAGYDPLTWNDRKMEIIEPFVGRYLLDFEKSRGSFAEDFMLQRFWAQPISRLQTSWLEKPEFRGRLIARLVGMYVKGLHAKSLEEGQKAREKMENDSLDTVAQMAAFEDALREKAAEWLRYAGEIWGAVDYEDGRAPPELPENRPRGKVSLTVPEGTKLELNRTLVVDAKVEELDGKFAKPYHYRWSFGRQPEVTPKVGDTLEFVKVHGGSAPIDSVVIRVEVRDSFGDGWETARRVGEAAIEITGSGVVAAAGVTTGEGKIYVLRVRVGNDEIGMEWHTVRLATPRRPIAGIHAQLLAKVKEENRRSPIVEVDVVAGPLTTMPDIPRRRDLGPGWSGR